MTYEPSAHFEVKSFDVEIPREGGVLLGRVCQPQGSGPFPMLVSAHGGAWSGGDRFSDEFTATALAETGILVLSPEFRIAPQDPYPAQMQDINLATRWLKTNGAALGGDPNAVGGIGSSSGGQAIVLSAMRPTDARYAALALSGSEDASLRFVIACWPVIDPLARYEYAQRVNNDRLIKNHDGYWLTNDAMAEGNPTRILERGEPAQLPPLLVHQGTADDNIPYEIVARFPEQWRAAGGAADLELYEGQPHGFGSREGAARDRMLLLTTAFIQRCVSGAAVAA